MPHFAVGKRDISDAELGEIDGQVPAHYNASGTIDRWGSKRESLILLALGWIIYLRKVYFNY
ncbi:DUF1648 domain-containing protein [Oscillibacter sp.]|uniref:DUF1648 domain-containing protein n=1 Tax=Oscillibacter sp. TaxID=1945593 RepID=UPI0037C78C76